MGDRALASVVIPARQEGVDIVECIAAVAAQDIGAANLEVVVVDGLSTDGTAELARAALRRGGFARGVVITNPEGSTPTSLNLGLHEVTAPVLCRVDARSVIPPHYVRRCVEILGRQEVAVVGGRQVARAREPSTVTSRAIARALRNPYATGLSRYRRSGAAAGPSDTVYLGAFRTADVRAAGGWDDRFLTNQDFELNRRMSARGLVWFEPDLAVVYRPRESFALLARQYRRFGRWKAAGWCEADVGVRPRQAALVLLPPVLAILGARLAARRRRLAAVVGAGALAVLTRVGNDEDDASRADQLLSLVATGIVGACWWAGVAEQLCRFACGERLLAQPGAADPSPVASP